MSPTISSVVNAKVRSKFFEAPKSKNYGKLLGVVKTPVKTLSVYAG